MAYTRRSIFHGLAGAPIAVPLAGYSNPPVEKAYTGAAMQCAECLNLMQYGNYRDGHVCKCWCPNEECLRYGVRYLAPMTVLERV